MQFIQVRDNIFLVKKKTFQNSEKEKKIVWHHAKSWSSWNLLKHAPRFVTSLLYLGPAPVLRGLADPADPGPPPRAPPRAGRRQGDRADARDLRAVHRRDQGQEALQHASQEALGVVYHASQEAPGSGKCSFGGQH